MIIREFSQCLFFLYKLIRTFMGHKLWTCKYNLVTFRIILRLVIYENGDLPVLKIENQKSYACFLQLWLNFKETTFILLDTLPLLMIPRGFVGKGRYAHSNTKCLLQSFVYFLVGMQPVCHPRHSMSERCTR